MLSALGVGEVAISASGDPTVPGMIYDEPVGQYDAVQSFFGSRPRELPDFVDIVIGAQVAGNEHPSKRKLLRGRPRGDGREQGQKQERFTHCGDDYTQSRGR